MTKGSDYIDFVMDKLSSLDTVSAKRMFGGHVIHMAGKVLGFVFDDCLLFEPGPTVDRLLPDAERRELFPGSKLFVVMDDAVISSRLYDLACACYDDFPVSKPRKRKGESRESCANRERDVLKRFPFAKYIED